MINTFLIALNLVLTTPPPPAYNSDAETLLLMDSKEIVCLAENMYFEARNQSDSGRMAVAMVTINRAKSERFPNTICNVIHQTKLNWKGNPKRYGCAFSWYCDYKSDTVYDRDTYIDILRSAALIYRDQDIVIDITKGATHYHAKYVNPWWVSEMDKTVTIGEHIFYKEGYR